MKNNCDVSGRYGDRAKCTGEIITDRCAFFLTDEYGVKCKNSNCGCCYSLSAIRAAIEEEGMKINCPACGAEKTLLCGCWKKTP